MKKIISQKDKKEYFLCSPTECAEYTYFKHNDCSVTLYGRGKYQVRKSENPGYVIFNGNIWNETEALNSSYNPIFPSNTYNGSYIYGCEIPVETAQKIFNYID